MAAFAPSVAQTMLLAKARAAGATELVPSAGPDGGMIVNGKLAGRLFVLALPSNWTGEMVLFGQGYALPGGTPTVPTDPIANDPGGGLFKHLYAEGVASGVAAFDKTGIATKSGAKNSIRLRTLAARLGATRFYAVGGSMGGSIVMALIERYPRKFSGAVSMCGVTEGWIPLVQQLADMRGAYNLLTEGTPYALPGDKDVTRSALPVVPPAGDATPGNAFREAQKMKVLMPILALFQAAKANPDGSEARIIRQVAAVGGFAPDPAALGAPLYSALLGMDDIVATMDGLPIGNIGKVYDPPEMNVAEKAEFNRRMQRFAASPKAVAYARLWHQATGRFRVPLVTVHQTIDALVPFAQSEGLGRVVSRAGNGAHLAQYAVPPTRFPLPGGLEGYTHCGFTPEQNIAAFEAMRNWVNTGQKPGPEAVQ
ncbi:alpha/beta fold hydrolase [Erythrobacter sp. 3-20A1M]|uniref:alpha/beta fold hydrolase n=1 Tax=Erythrobacter sp. 3-20A1M TaxID=2653850 RepID=UPI001BFCD0C1|nr:alpha/beta fold hydrolase [Erythrobacter sp. 3-20A1M]